MSDLLPDPDQFLSALLYDPLAPHNPVSGALLTDPEIISNLLKSELTNLSKLDCQRIRGGCIASLVVGSRAIPKPYNLVNRGRWVDIH
jgi:hypothetical protein